MQQPPEPPNAADAAQSASAELGAANEPNAQQPQPQEAPTDAASSPIQPAALPEAADLKPAQESLSLPATTLAALNALLHQQAKSSQARNLRRNVWLAIVVALLCIFVAWPMLRGPSNAGATQKHVALIKLEGTIELGSAAAAEPINSAMQAAFEDAASVAVLLHMNSPGGSPVQAAAIYDEINRLRTKYNKPLFAVVEEICTSACYYIASAADEIVANPASMVGSIGVLMDGFGASELMKKLGVERRLYTAGDNKGMLDPFSPSNPKHRVIIDEMLVSVHQMFIKAVREGRADKLKESPELFSGRVFTGQQAISNGLIDSEGTVASVARDTIEVDNIVDYSPKENIAERVAKKLGASFGGALGASAARSVWQSQSQSQPTGVWK